MFLSDQTMYYSRIAVTGKAVGGHAEPIQRRERSCRPTHAPPADQYAGLPTQQVQAA